MPITFDKEIAVSRGFTINFNFSSFGCVWEESHQTIFYRKIFSKDENTNWDLDGANQTSGFGKSGF